jgi:hypothetical protein
MKERPILFNAEMVKAILSGRKTQTRRVVKFPLRDVNMGCELAGNELAGEVAAGDYRNCPLGKPGDQLWVRETFAAGLCTETTLAYKATHKPEDLEEGWWETIKWTPSIHMPRWASRIDLLITGVRVERLSSLTNADAKAEGYPAEREIDGGSTDAWLWFRELWDFIYQNWQENPWVWVIEFERIGGDL